MENLPVIAQRSRRRYAERVAGAGSGQWWTAVVVTASSRRQAERYEWEIRRREDQGKLPAGVRYLVVPDLHDQRIGSGGATLHALHALAATVEDLGGWWKRQRVLMIHSGGDSRRLPQYSLSGKLFSALPVKTPWGEASTVFDETLAQSTGWVERLATGLVVGSGDVVPTFDAEALEWAEPGVCGVAMRQPAEVGAQHGVYVADEQGRVYAFLQKPSVAEVKAAGGLLADGQVALDIGLLRFDAGTAARLTGLRIEEDARGRLPVMDLYRHVTMALTGQWSPGVDDHAALHGLAAALRGTPFRCSIVCGDFTHVGTTALFRRLMTEETEFSKLYAAHQRMGATGQAGVESAGMVVDSVLGGGEVGPGAVVVECNVDGPVRAGRGAVLHGLEGIHGAVEVPEDTVAHQVPVALEDGRRGVVTRVYGVWDDPKAAGVEATWLGRPLREAIEDLGLDAGEVWTREERTLWNAGLFPVTTADEAWACARWMMGLGSEFTASRWRELERLSLETSAQWADTGALGAAQARRLRASWGRAAEALAESGADIRPLLAHSPGMAALVETGRKLRGRGAELEATAPTEAASRYYQASRFLAQAGLEGEAEESVEAAFGMVRRAVENPGTGTARHTPQLGERSQSPIFTVAAPARIDLGGGWSDTPPFCLDWGGTVLNAAVELNGEYPIRTTVRRLEEPVVRLVSDTGEVSIHRAALEMTGVGAGIEIRTEVNLPMGSGLGTSSILGATVLRALAEFSGVELSDQELSDQVMRLEQLMTTGGGWQDQAGGIFPGVKLVSSGPGLRQQLRVEPVAWSQGRKAEFESLMVLYYTGIRRIAKRLLQQVVGSYLARETGTVQVLHSIKTLAMEMAHAMREGDWDYLGQLLDRHWELNKALDPHTTNAPINRLLGLARPYIRGAKLAGAGGGGFLMLLAKGVEEARELREALRDCGGAVYEWRVAEEGVRVSR